MLTFAILAFAFGAIAEAHVFNGATHVASENDEKYSMTYEIDNGSTPTPSAAPTLTSTPKPTPKPKPSYKPTLKPTIHPTSTPTIAPTLTPTPTIDPTLTPTPIVSATANPTATGTLKPMATVPVNPPADLRAYVIPDPCATAMPNRLIVSISTAKPSSTAPLASRDMPVPTVVSGFFEGPARSLLMAILTTITVVSLFIFFLLRRK